MNGTLAAWLLFVSLSCIGCLIGALIWDAIRKIDRRRLDFQRADWIAERHRRVARNGFKTRAGIR